MTDLDSVVSGLKAQFPNRKVRIVRFQDDESELEFVMTSPVREEWKKYRREITDAKSDIERIEAAIEKAALAQIRYPARDEVKEIFETRPGLVQSFASELATLAGAQLEASAKNA